VQRGHGEGTRWWRVPERIVFVAIAVRGSSPVTGVALGPSGARPRRGGGAGSRGRSWDWDVGRKGISCHDLERCDVGGEAVERAASADARDRRGGPLSLGWRAPAFRTAVRGVRLSSPGARLSSSSASTLPSSPRHGCS